MITDKREVSFLPLLTLVSASPRRRKLLEEEGIPLRCTSVQIDETPLRGVSPEAVPLSIAEKKMKAFMNGNPDSLSTWSIAADTLIIDEMIPIGKPADFIEAELILKRFSGRSHKVITGVILHPPNAPLVSFSEESIVTFRQLDSVKIKRYVDIGEWKDAAGGYKIQEKGRELIEKIEGSYTNVIGLPIKEVLETLHKHGYFGNKHEVV